MTKLLLLAIVLFLGNSGISLSQQNDFIIDNEKAGPFYKNMPLEDALKIAERKYKVVETTISFEGDDYLVYEIFQGSELLLKLEPTCGKECYVWRIWIHSDRYKTSKGIGIGSTIADVLNNYTFKHLQTEGSVRCLFVKEYDVCFDLDSNAFSYEWFINGAKFEDIPKDTKITLIIP